MNTWLMLGDSHTYGQSGYAICDALALARPNIRIVNGGVNADLAWNLAERMEALLGGHPALIHVLIGSNDVNAGLHPDHAAGYMRDKAIPQLPTSEFYRTQLRRMFERLTQTGARLFASQIPPIGDEADSAWNASVRRHNDILLHEATRSAVTIIPLYDQLMAIVDRERVRPIDRLDWGRWIPESQHLHDEQALRWDVIAERRGLQLTHDGLHLNERSGRIWLDLLLNHFDTHLYSETASHSPT